MDANRTVEGPEGNQQREPQESFLQVGRLGFVWSRCAGCAKGDTGHVNIFGLAKSGITLCDSCLAVLHRKLDETQPEDRERVLWP